MWNACMHNCEPMLPEALLLQYQCSAVQLMACALSTRVAVLVRLQLVASPAHCVHYNQVPLPVSSFSAHF